MQRCHRIWAWYSLWKSSLSMAFSYVSQIHDKLRYYEKHSPTPVLHSAACLAEDVRTIFPSRIPSQLEINVCDKDTLFIERCGASLESGWFSFCPPVPYKKYKISWQRSFRTARWRTMRRNYFSCWTLLTSRFDLALLPQSFWLFCSGASCSVLSLTS